MRIDSLDILKGIGIILVVVGHMIGNQLYIRPWIYAFHMPLFFMVSGYCFNIAKHPNLELPLTYRLVQIPMCLLFYLIGNSLRKYAIVERFLMNSKWMPLWKYCLLGLLGYVLTYVYVRTDALKHNQEILNYFEIGMVLACFSAIVGVASFSVFCLKRMPKLGNVLIYR